MFENNLFKNSSENKIDFFRTQKTSMQTGTYENISMQSLIKKGRVSVKQKEIANNYMVIKKIFGFCAVHSRISATDNALLKHYNMKPLEESGSLQIIKELEILIDWYNSSDAVLKSNSDKIFEIRVKELKFLQANHSMLSLGELNNGYQVLEKYIEYLAG